MSETERGPRGRSVMESMVEAQCELNRMAMDDPEGYMRAVAAIVAERTERRYMEIVESPDVPPGEVWIVQPAERRRIWGSDGKRNVSWNADIVERPAKIVGKIVNAEEPE